MSAEKLEDEDLENGNVMPRLHVEPFANWLEKWLQDLALYYYLLETLLPPEALCVVKPSIHLGICERAQRERRAEALQRMPGEN